MKNSQINQYKNSSKDHRKSGLDYNKAAPIPDRCKKNKKVAIITTDGVEDSEFFYPYYRLNEAGYEVEILTDHGLGLTAKYGSKLNDTKIITNANPEDYALIYISGGNAPIKLRENKEVIKFITDFAKSGKSIASICHGALLLIEANLIKNKKIAAWIGIKDEIREAGAEFSDEALQIDGQFITARMPGDLHRHLCGVLDYLKQEG